MRQKFLFSKTRKEAPKDEVSKNASLLIRGGYIHKEMAGVYSFLPLGLRVLNNVVRIIREEINAIGGQEIFMSALQDGALWKSTNRWDDKIVDIWFKTKLKNETEVGLAFTHEEPLTALMKNHLRSYKDLPICPYQFQTKFRNEARAKSGIMRGREFLMKDLYSFSKTGKEHDEFYERVKGAYKKIFDRAGIGEKTYLTYASGGSFSKYSHEFQTVTDAGEDIIYVCHKCNVAVNDEIISENSACPECKSAELEKRKAVEVGNIFNLGTRFSEAFELAVIDEGGKKLFPIMGSYGIGPGRLLGAVVELLSGENTINWPKDISPMQAHIILVSTDEAVRSRADELYNSLQQMGFDLLFDDRDIRAGEKFRDADLIGVPIRIIVSDTHSSPFEVKWASEVKYLDKDQIASFLKEHASYNKKN